MGDTTISVDKVTDATGGGKSILASKTFWLNTLGGIAAGAATYGGYVPPKYAPAVIAVGSISNILLRLITKQPIQ